MASNYEKPCGGTHTERLVRCRSKGFSCAVLPRTHTCTHSPKTAPGSIPAKRILTHGFSYTPTAYQLSSWRPKVRLLHISKWRRSRHGARSLTSTQFWSDLLLSCKSAWRSWRVGAATPTIREFPYDLQKNASFPRKQVRQFLL